MPATIHLALGSNRRHGRHGSPDAVIAAAIVALAAAGMTVIARSATRATPPLGPRQRRFANAAVTVTADLPLADVLKVVQQIEHAFGRRPGQRWGPRVLDLDIIAAGTAILPSAGWRTAHAALIVPHRGLAGRRFVLDPLVDIAPEWRHPVLHLTARQLRVRLRRPRRSVAGSP